MRAPGRVRGCAACGRDRRSGVPSQLRLVALVRSYTGVGALLSVGGISIRPFVGDGLRVTIGEAEALDTIVDLVV